MKLTLIKKYSSVVFKCVQFRHEPLETNRIVTYTLNKKHLIFQSIMLSSCIIFVHGLVSPTLIILTSSECRTAFKSLLSYAICCLMPLLGQDRMREKGSSQRRLAMEQAKQATAWRREQLCESHKALGQLQSVKLSPPSIQLQQPLVNAPRTISNDVDSTSTKGNWLILIV